MKQRIIVIGAGAAGLAAAARLAKRGHDVMLFEKNDEPGGKIATVQRDGFIWDAGPSVFTDKKEFDRLFRDCQRNPRDYYSTVALDEASRYFYPNGQVVYGYDSAQKLAEEFERVFNEPKKNTHNYLKQASYLYNQVSSHFLDSPIGMSSVKNKQALNALGKIPLSLLYQSLHSENARSFRTPEVQMFFDRFATYNGSNPYKTPGIFSCLPHLEHNLGAMYVRGGMQSLAKAMHKLGVDMGVKYYFSTPIKKITHSDGKVTGIITDNGWVEADVVISAVDMNFLYNELLPPSRVVAKKYLENERSLSAVVFLWGMDRTFDQLTLHNIFFSDNYQMETNMLWREKKLSKDPTVYVNVTSKMDAQHAPEGSENWFVMTNAPSRIDYVDWIPKMRRRVIKKLSEQLGVDIKNHISTEVALDPRHFHQTYNANQGALYGAASNTFKSAFFRHPNQGPDYKNLYTIGVTTHPGGGIPLALRSARIVDTLLKKKE